MKSFLARIIACFVPQNCCYSKRVEVLQAWPNRILRVGIVYGSGQPGMFSGLLAAVFFHLSKPIDADRLFSMLRVWLCR